MDSERRQQVKLDPPNRGSIGFLALQLQIIRAFLSRLFGKRHPAGFDTEFGSWLDLDFNLEPGSGSPAPRPLVVKDCEESHLIYRYIKIPTERCSLAGRLAALQQAIDEVAQYQRDEFRCQDPRCPQKTGEPVWVGLGCGTLRGPNDEAAVLVRLRCIPER